MKTPQQAAEEYAEKWNEGEPGDPDVAYTSFLAGYSVAMEQKWISVEERLPDNNERVLCYSIYGRYVENSYSIGSDQDEEWFKSKFTHYQSLPSPPSRKENNLKTK